MKITATIIFLFIGLVYSQLNEDYLNLNFNDENENFISDFKPNEYNIKNEPALFDHISLNENLNEFDNSNFQVKNEGFSSELDNQLLVDQQQPHLNDESSTNHLFPEFFDFHQEFSDYFGNEPDLISEKDINFDQYQTPLSQSNVVNDNLNGLFDSNSNFDNSISNKVDPVLDFFDQLPPNSNTNNNNNNNDNNQNLFENQIQNPNSNPSPWIYTFRAEEAGISKNNKYSTILNALTQISSIVPTSTISVITKDQLNITTTTFTTNTTTSCTTNTTPNSPIFNITSGIDDFMNVSNLTLSFQTSSLATNQTVSNLNNEINSFIFKQNKTNALKKGISFENSPKLDDMYDSESLPNLDHSQLVKSNSMHFVEKRIHSGSVFPNGR